LGYGSGMPGRNMAARDIMLGDFVRSSLAPGTWAAYTKVWTEWEEMVGQTGGESSAADRYMSALAFWFKFNRWEDLTKNFLVKQALRGFRKGKRAVDTRSFCLGLLRGVPHWFEDVVIGQDKIEIQLRRSKTDVFGKGRKVVLFSLPGSEVCPVACGHEFLCIRPGESGCFFVHEDGWALSRFQFARVFRMGLQQLGLHPMQFGTHSFRIGAATEAARLGLGDERIKQIGRWESMRFRLVTWLVGHSYVYWAQKRAAVRRNETQLGFLLETVELQWFGFRGFSWQSISGEIFRRVSGGASPDIILIHGGGNDLGLIPQRELIRRMQRDLDRLRELVPGVVVVWSEMVPRFNWRHARDSAAVARCRGKVNKAMSVFVRRSGGVAVRHWELEGMLPGYFRKDGVHLSEVGCDLLNLGFQEGI
ncbi:hypothetical protein XELAEV_18005938mg, partial [Pelobates cultripes]